MFDMNNIKNVALVSLNLVIAVIAFKAIGGLVMISKGALKVGAEAGELLADAYITLFLPSVVSSQIRIKSSYFNKGILTPQAESVLMNSYPDLYELMFVDGRMLPQYRHYINSDTPLSNRGALEVLGRV